MKTLLVNGNVVNVFSCTVKKQDVLLEGDVILAVGDLQEESADVVVDLQGRTLCPGLVDVHMHIESTMLVPGQLVKAVLRQGTTALLADPHEIANVLGEAGIQAMLDASEDLPADLYFMLPSCVPAGAAKDAVATLEAADLRPFYDHPRVLGLAEVMDVPAVLQQDPDMLAKLQDARDRGALADGHAPLLAGRDLDRYIAAGIQTDHECSVLEEAQEKIEKGMWVYIRQGTAAGNLKDLMGLFRFPWACRCCLCTDDKHPDDLLEHGHMNGVLKDAVALGADPVLACRMATFNACQALGLQQRGAIAPGWKADLVVFEDLTDFRVRDVWKDGEQVVQDGEVMPFAMPALPEAMLQNTMHRKTAVTDDFILPEAGRRKAHVIGLMPETLVSEDRILELDLDQDNGVDLDRDILKIAVLDRHKDNGAMGLGFVQGAGIKAGAIASSVAHDSHNLVVLGTNEADMAAAANAVRDMKGGLAAVKDGKVLASMMLPVAGLMSTGSAQEAARANQALRQAIKTLGTEQELFMTAAFLCLPVIPYLKITTRGLEDHHQQCIPLFIH